MDQMELERRVAELRSSRPWTQDEAQVVLDAWAGSGESVAEFARRMKLVPQRLFWWRQRLASDRPPRPAGAAVSAPAFVPLVVRPEPMAGDRVPMAVLVRGAARVELRELSAASAAWAAAVLRSLEEAAP